MIADLVPSNHRLCEHALAEVLAPISGISPAPIETIWDAWRCPVPLLPYLAYALSVDLWDDTWDEISKRRAIAAAPELHRKKGTRWAVEQAVAAACGKRATRIIEWHERSPEGRRGTFTVQIPIQDGEDLAGLAATVALTSRLVSTAKPKSRAFAIDLTREIDVTFAPSVGLQADERVELFAPPDDVGSVIAPAAGVMALETVSLGGY